MNLIKRLLGFGKKNDDIIQWNSEAIPETDLREAWKEHMLAIYDYKKRQVLFGGAYSELDYLGKLDGKHIARAGKLKNYGFEEDGDAIVDEDGNTLFGGWYIGVLTLMDSHCDGYHDIIRYPEQDKFREKVSGIEDTLVEIDGGYDDAKISLYDKSGKALIQNIPIQIVYNDEIFEALELRFRDVKGRRCIEVKYNSFFSFLTKIKTIRVLFEVGADSLPELIEVDGKVYQDIGDKQIFDCVSGEAL